MDLSPLLLSLKVALTATALATVTGLALAILVTRVHFMGKTLLEAFLTLPLVLPPSVVGYYLLMIMGRDGPLGWLGWLFTWKAAVMASWIVALPLMFRAAKSALESVDPSLEMVARTLGVPPWKAFLDVTLPLASRGITAGVILSFARALGEFGATLMVAGNIPGKTRTIPLAIYTAVQANRMDTATFWVVITVFLAFIFILIVNKLQAR
ncbi:MAG: molybdate ABC transporter permease subunit [Anaerolineae bacterium]|nr:molybdate ABC transporter permease subunit [Anaerolineae bacterium]MDW8103134.1 molybdate ABC transporter permease subunit [Anaerolineae bacterium]